MAFIEKTLDTFAKYKRIVCSAMLVIMLAITFSQVTMRYVFDSPFKWSEEVTLILLVWFGFLCMSLDIKTDSHAAIYMIYDKFPPIMKTIADVVRHGLLIYFNIAMILFGYKLTTMNMPKRLPASRLSQGLLYAPLIIGGIFMAIYSIFNLICVFYKKREGGNAA